MKSKSCKTCFFFVWLNSKNGHCKRYPPQSYPAKGLMESGSWRDGVEFAFPVMEIDDWCGCWEEKKF
jgi:hypothetical protein